MDHGRGEGYPAAVLTPHRDSLGSPPDSDRLKGTEEEFRVVKKILLLLVVVAIGLLIAKQFATREH